MVNMITREEIDRAAIDLGVKQTDVQRDYVFGWLLSGIANHSSLRHLLVLNGGNCFRKAYIEGARFSGDLDFSTQSAVDEAALAQGVNEACQFASDRSGVSFALDKTRVSPKRGADSNERAFDVRVYFRGFYGEESYDIRAKLDVGEFDRLFLPVQDRPIIHAYSDREQCSGTIRCLKLEELLAGKLKALLQRQHSPDLYDFVYSVFIQNALQIDRSELVSTFLRKTIYQPNPGVARHLLLSLPFHLIRGFWDAYLVTPRTSSVSFDDAESRFREGITELFGSFGEASEHALRTLFYPAEYRSLLMTAGREQKLVRMMYKGVERMVEPYSLQYKAAQGRHGREYFYGVDITGGTSGVVGIKMYTADNVQSMEMTDTTFEPRHTIELSKAGDVPDKIRFEGRRRTSGLGSISRARVGRVPTFLSPKQYTLQCPMCQKTFKRARMSETTLNSHKNSWGTKCSGRRGYWV